MQKHICKELQVRQKFVVPLCNRKYELHVKVDTLFTIGKNRNSMKAVYPKLPYTLDITPPLIISPPPPYYFQKFAVEIYLSPIYAPPSAIHGKFDKNGRTLQLRQTRGRLELTVPPCIESSYLLGSDTPTKQLTTWRQARS